MRVAGARDRIYGASLPVADCGHPHMGVALDGQGRSYCYPCSNRAERLAMGESDTYFVYLASDGRTATDWAGGFLGRVTYLRKGRHNIGGYLYRIRVTDWAGGQWYGTSPGPGMYARLRRRTRPYPTRVRARRGKVSPRGLPLGTLQRVRGQA